MMWCRAIVKPVDETHLCSLGIFCLEVLVVVLSQLSVGKTQRAVPLQCILLNMSLSKLTHTLPINQIDT